MMVRGCAKATNDVKSAKAKDQVQDMMDGFVYGFGYC
jgi:hypothetical protein